MVASLLVMAACDRGAPTPPAIALAASLPLSGSDAEAGSAMRHGYQRAVDEANAGGGLQLAAPGVRVPVTLIVEDDAAETPRAEAYVSEFVKNGAHVILATHTSVRAIAQAQVAEREGCPYVVNPTDAAGLPGARMSWVFSVPAPGTDAEARAYETAKGALAVLGRASRIDPAHVRIAFHGL